MGIIVASFYCLFQFVHLFVALCECRHEWALFFIGVFVVLLSDKTTSSAWWGGAWGQIPLQKYWLRYVTVRCPHTKQHPAIVWTKGINSLCYYRLSSTFRKYLEQSIQ